MSPKNPCILCVFKHDGDLYVSLFIFSEYVRGHEYLVEDDVLHVMNMQWVITAIGSLRITWIENFRREFCHVNELRGS